jgi:hypothetical protein
MKLWGQHEIDERNARKQNAGQQRGEQRTWDRGRAGQGFYLFPYFHWIPVSSGPCS